MLRSIRDWLFARGSDHGISGSVYAALWSLGLSGTCVSFIQLYSSQENPSVTEKFVVGLLGITMVLLQTIIYWDLHKIEGNGPMQYPNWINLRFERILRGSIIFSLLFGVGEVAHIFLPLVRYIQVPAVRDRIQDFLRSPEARDLSHSLFVKGSIAAFALLVVWNSFAVFFCTRQWPGKGSRAPRVVILCRVEIGRASCRERV